MKFNFGSISSFKFKPVDKKRVIKHDGNKKLTTKLIKGICFKENGEYKISLDVKILKPNIIDEGQPDILVLDFTEESYNLKGIKAVFGKEPDEHGKYIRYIRRESEARFFPGSSEKLVPFCPNWVCSGYILRRDGKLVFDFNECIAPKGYDVFVPDVEDK